MAPIPGSVRVTGFIAPSDSADTYSSHNEIYGAGGFRSVANAAARLAITSDRRIEGMLVKQLDTSEIWTLQGGIADINWVLDPLWVSDALRKIVNIGNVYFVDTDAGVNAAARGTYSLPLKTIAYCHTNYVTANHNDVVLCYASAGGSFNENVAVTGLTITKDTTIFIGISDVAIDNTNGGATHVIYLNAIGCKIMGFHVVPTVSTRGMEVLKVRNIIGDPNYPMIFDGTTCTNECIGLSADLNIVQNCNIRLVDANGVYLATNNNIVRECNISTHTVGHAGSVGLEFALTAHRNMVENVQIAGAAIGIEIQSGATSNTFNNVTTAQCTLNISELNAGITDNSFSGINIPSRIAKGNTTPDDLYAIYSAAQSGSFMGIPWKTGNMIFVEASAGVDAAGRGTLALPLATIQYAHDNYVTAGNNDIVVCWDITGTGFDEAANVTGLTITKSNTIYIGVNGVAIDNSNGGATSTVYLHTDWGGFFGFFVFAEGIGIDVNSTQYFIGSEEFPVFISSGTPGLKLRDGNNWAKYVHCSNATTGISVASARHKVEHCYVEGNGNAGDIGIQLVGGCNNNFVHDNHITQVGIGFDIVAGSTLNIVSENYIKASVSTINDATAPGANSFINNHILSQIANNNTLEEDLGDIYTAVGGMVQDDGINSTLTVANGTTAQVLKTIATGVKDTSFTINGAYAGGGNDSFKAHAAALSYLEAYIETQTLNDANWRRVTASSDEYRLYQNDTQDCLVIDNVTLQNTCRLVVKLSVAPTDTIDLDWQSNHSPI